MSQRRRSSPRVGQRSEVPPTVVDRSEPTPGARSGYSWLVPALLRMSAAQTERSRLSMTAR